MNASVFIATSLDGFIARANGAIGWLPPGGGEEHGYDAFIASVDALVIGRNTFETVLTFGTWPYGEKPVFVLTTRTLPVATPAGAVLERMSGDPREIVSQLALRGVRHIYVDGGITIQRFLRRLIQRLIITRIPVLLGDGIPLFGAVPGDVALRDVATRQYATGLVQSEYVVGA
jgi:dihydrofolate reductase